MSTNRVLCAFVGLFLTTGFLAAQPMPAAQEQALGISSKGRLHVEQSNAILTGGSFANASSQSATVSYFFTDAAGSNSSEASFVIPPNGQIARFFNELSPAAPSRGTFTYNSTAPLSVTGLRALINEAGQFLLTTTPAVPVSPAPNEVVIIPHWADGGGFSVQVVLVNNTNRTIDGMVQFRRSTGEPATLTINGNSGALFPYSISARSSISLVSAGVAAGVQTGSVRITPAGSSPSAFDIVAGKNGNVTQVIFAVPGSR